ncbi:crossover junction endodeoxyribonuclease RuvC [Citricoccus nitrophenolicus]|uniref:crossover junction endodeoxyribonuclease RuvC n=1 Tax=Citricoccus muralis TaxID=169134 RepID=UPI001FEC8864|nr:crossover junction endodeoxyribonuclease RuvC [Citricoccus muralis]
MTVSPGSGARRAPSPLRVLGVDPGLTRCGIAVVDVAPNRTATLVAVTVVGSPAEQSLDLRLLAIDEAINEWLDRHSPDHVAVERMFAQNNTPTVMGTAQASGVVIAAAARRGIPVALHTPSEVKAAVTGSGTAGKDQVTAMVTRILRLDAPPKPADAADALALAITHAWRGGLMGGGLETGNLTSPQRASRFPTPAGGSGGHRTGGSTPAQQAWLAAEQRSRGSKGWSGGSRI